MFGFDKTPTLDREVRIVDWRFDLNPLSPIDRISVPEDPQETLVREEPFRKNKVIRADLETRKHGVLFVGGTKVSELVLCQRLGASHEHVVCKFNSLGHEWC